MKIDDGVEQLGKRFMARENADMFDEWWECLGKTRDKLKS